MTSMTATILLVDDQEMMREALAQHLASQSGFEVVASVSNHQSAIEAAEEHQPDVALLDIEVPGLDCFVAAREIADKSPKTRIVFLSAFCRDAYIEQALEVGTAGYIVKGEEPGVLHRAIETVVGGGTYFSEEVENRLVLGNDGLKVSEPLSTRAASLTKREREILRYIAVGMSKKEIASLVDLSVRTVDAHVRNIMGKLDLHDRVELARFAIREGLAPQ
ncbi:MAG: DNA-binding response regulator [Deltaproteobacteria bacterium]|nr:DNA-binding response regulator [Deltaproteobacteria bacterium]